MKKRYLLLAIAVLAAPFASFADAGAAFSPASSDVYSVTVNPNDPSTGKVSASYRCQPGDVWLWSSAKQVENGSKDPALAQEGSSSIASAWVQSHTPNKLICDGQKHSGTFPINTNFDPENGGGFGQLQRGGWAWVQFCLIDGQGNFTSSMKFLRVG